MNHNQSVERLDDIKKVVVGLPVTDNVKAQVLFLVGEAICATSDSGLQSIQNPDPLGCFKQGTDIIKMIKTYWDGAGEYDPSKKYEGILPPKP